MKPRSQILNLGRKAAEADSLSNTELLTGTVFELLSGRQRWYTIQTDHRVGNPYRQAGSSTEATETGVHGAASDALLSDEQDKYR